MNVISNRGRGTRVVVCLASLGLAVAVSAPLTSATPLADDQGIALKVDRVLTGAGDPVEGGFLVLKDDKIVAVGVAEAPAGTRVVELPGTTACAGFVDAVTQLGGGNQFEEPARALTPKIDAAEAFDPFSDDFDRAARGGLTTVGLSPSSSNLIGGRIAVAHTRGSGEEASLSGGGPLRLALTGSAYQSTRAPTSRMGALAVLREAVASGLEGDGGLVIDVGSVDEIRLALSTLKPANRPIVLLGAASADRALRHLKDSNATTILGPYGIGSTTRALRTPAAVHGEGIAVALTGRGSATALRLAAVLAVREGLDVNAALAAITSVPAGILGRAEEIGTLERGKRADVLIFDGHPLDLSARLRAVYAGGVSVDLDDE